MVSMRVRPLACVAGVAKVAERLLAPTPLGLAGPRPITAGAPSATVPDDTVELRLLAVNDLHGAISADRAVGGRAIGGAAYLAAHLARLKAGAPSRTLVAHVGDAVSASPAVSAILQDEPSVATMNQIGVDVGVVGNHEFDEGVPELLRLLHGGSHPSTYAFSGRFPGSAFPWLAANVLDKATGTPLLRPYQIFTLDGITIGFIGVVTTETPTAVGGGVQELAFLEEAATVNRYGAELKARGVDMIVVLAHLGGTAPAPEGPVSGPIVDFAEAVDASVDVILSGHTHQPYVTTIAGKLVVQAWPYATGFATVDLTFERRTGRVVAKDAALMQTWNDEVDPEPVVAAMVAKYEAFAAPVLGQALARAATPITRARNEAGEEALGDLIADAYRWQTGADVGIAHPGWNWADIDAGSVTWSDLFLVQPANRDLVTIELTGAQVIRLLEEQWAPGRLMPLHVSGLAYDFVRERPPGSRVVGARVLGKGPVKPTSHYVVTLDTFLAGGGGGYTVPTESLHRRAGPKDLEALIAYIRQLPQPLRCSIDGRSRCVAPRQSDMRGASVRFASTAQTAASRA